MKGIPYSAGELQGAAIMLKRQIVRQPHRIADDYHADIMEWAATTIFSLCKVLREVAALGEERIGHDLLADVDAAIEEATRGHGKDENEA